MTTHNSAHNSLPPHTSTAKAPQTAGIHTCTQAPDPPEPPTPAKQQPPNTTAPNARTPPNPTNKKEPAAPDNPHQHPPTTVPLQSQHVDEPYATDLLATNPSNVGYLLKQRLADIQEFTQATRRIPALATTPEPQAAAQLLARRHSHPLDRLTPREREILELMAGGRSNPAIAAELAVSESALTQHINSILTKPDLPTADTDHRHAMAVPRIPSTTTAQHTTTPTHPATWRG